MAINDPRNEIQRADTPFIPVPIRTFLTIPSHLERVARRRARVEPRHRSRIVVSTSGNQNGRKSVFFSAAEHGSTRSRGQLTVN